MPFRSLLKLLDWSSVGSEPPIVTPKIDEYGLVDVPASLYLFSFEGAARRAAKLVGHRPVVSVAKRGIDKAVDADGIFHMWFHPHNLLQPDGTERLDAILEHLNRRRNESDLRFGRWEASRARFRANARFRTSVRFGASARF